MTKLSTVVIGLVVFVLSFGTGLSAAGQETEVLTVQQAVEELGVVPNEEELTLVVIHLNDKSVEALFTTAPNMQQLQEQAAEATMLFVQGTNGSSDVVAPDLDWQVRRGDELVTTRAVNISNFEEGSAVPGGERYSGLVVADKLIDHRSQFVVENGERQFTFTFSETQIELIEGS